MKASLLTSDDGPSLLLVLPDSGLKLLLLQQLVVLQGGHVVVRVSEKVNVDNAQSTLKLS